MKKTLFIFLGLIALNSNIFSMENDQETAEKRPKAQLSKMDWAKVTAAGLGCLAFGGTALMTRSTVTRLTRGESAVLFNFPSLLMGLVFSVPAIEILKYTNTECGKPSMYLGGITAGLFSCGLGAYVYKKLSALRSNRLAQSKK